MTENGSMEMEEIRDPPKEKEKELSAEDNIDELLKREEEELAAKEGVHAIPPDVVEEKEQEKEGTKGFFKMLKVIFAPSKKKKAVPKPKKKGQVSVISLFRFADALDIFLVVLGVIMSIGHGVLLPLFAIIFGEIINAFGTSTPINLTGNVTTLAIQFALIATAASFSSFFQVWCFMVSGQRQANRIRQAYFR